MKRFCLLFMCLVALAASGQEAAPALKFAEQVWDFGAIKETGGKVSHRFDFTNAGTTPIVIESVEVSCGCTTPSYSRAPVMPGKTGSITVTYNPDGRPGVFLKDIIVVSGNGRNANTLKIKGTVTPRPRTVEDDYPFELLQGVRLTTSYINFDRVGQGQAKSMVVGYINTSRKDAELKVVNSDPDANPWFRVSSPGVVCAGCKGEITLTFDLTRTTAWGMLTAPADIYVNGIRNAHGLLATVLATDNFNGVNIETAARSKLDIQFFHFGDVAADSKPLTREFNLENTGGAPLVVRAVKCGDGATTTLKEDTSIDPGCSVRFTITISLLPEGPMAGRVARSVTLITNDPVRPLREIRLVANVK